MKTLSRILLFLAFLSFFAFGSICWFFSSLIVHPSNTEIEDDISKMPDRWGTKFETVMASLSEPDTFSVLSEDKIAIKGWYFDHPDTATCAVIYAHGWGSSRAGMLKFADIFWDCGCDLVFYDHRVHNESGGSLATAGIKEKMDLLQVTEWVETKTDLGAQQIAWFGESWGAATVLQAGALDKDVAFIVADSPFQDWDSAIFERAKRDYGAWIEHIASVVMSVVDWRIALDHNLANPREAAKKIAAPVFLIHSKNDRATASQQSVNISKNLNPATSVFHHTDWGSDHVQDVITRPEEYRALLYDFVQKKVGEFGSCK